MDGLKSHKTVLENLMPKSGEYPVDLREAKSILVEEQPNLIPVYMDLMYVNHLESRVIDRLLDCDDAMTRIEKKKVENKIDKFRGDIRNFIYGMKNYGLSGFPDMITLTDDLNSSNPAVTNPENPNYSFEIRPKEFRLGLTGRILEDGKGQRYNESLFVALDIYDAFDFARSISPNKVFALMPDGKERLVYENKRYVIGKTEKLEVPSQKKTYVMSEHRKLDWLCETEVLPTNGLKVVFHEFYEEIKKYENGTFLFGHKFKGIDEFLSYATLLDNHLIWKICKSEINNPNNALIDAEPYYGKYGGNPRYENIGRLHFMPDRANLGFNGTTISFDKETGIKALMDLGDIVRDLWIGPSAVGQKDGWDIVFDRTRKITPNNPVHVKNNVGYQKYPVVN